MALTLIATLGAVMGTPATAGASLAAASAGPTTISADPTPLSSTVAKSSKPKKRKGWLPRQGPLFNNPFAGKKAKNRLARQVKRAIDEAKKNSVIRIAVYSFNRQELANSLMAACRRKVAVQIVVSDANITRQIRSVRRALGKGTSPKWRDTCHPRKKSKNRNRYPDPSFLVVCRASCRYRNHNGYQHIKMFLFSRTGRARNVVMTGSNNMATYAAHVHWNDLFTLREKPSLFNDWSTVFKQLSKDRRVQQPYAVFEEPPYVTEFGPAHKARGNKDPIARRLKRIDCKGRDARGARFRTEIKVTMYAWVGTRGVDLARRMAKLAREGCKVKTILSSPGARVINTLRSAGVQMRSADLNLDRKEETGFDETPWEKFTHEKWLSVRGGYDGRVGHWTWTGSENWANKSYSNDEMTVQIPGRKTWRQYRSHFNFVWRHHTRRVGARYARELQRYWERQALRDPLGADRLG